ncbi:MAG: TIGR00730 family Rossman fold protein, partial [Candidatus Eremiobacteraeota bacterium]|nr:TIGR00730 family Rossman fold protein [Candidatus Eremiobacteraeota bacterium]
MRVCVYCGSSAGNDPRFAAVARAFGAALARAGIGVVYGGGRVGLMGAVADAALEAGGEVIGVIPRFLEDREVAHRGVDLRVVESMHERKQLMSELSDA